MPVVTLVAEGVAEQHRRHRRADLVTTPGVSQPLMVAPAHLRDDTTVDGDREDLRCCLAPCECPGLVLPAEDAGAFVDLAGGRRANVGARDHAAAVGELGSSRDGSDQGATPITILASPSFPSIWLSPRTPPCLEH